MLKQLLAFVLLVVLSLLIISFTPAAQHCLNALMGSYEWISEALKQIFTGGRAGNLIRQLIAVLCLPFLIALVPTLIYWLMRRHWAPFFMLIVWIVWLVEVTAIIAEYKTALI